MNPIKLFRARSTVHLLQEYVWGREPFDYNDLRTVLKEKGVDLFKVDREVDDIITKASKE